MGAVWRTILGLAVGLGVTGYVMLSLWLIGTVHHKESPAELYTLMGATLLLAGAWLGFLIASRRARSRRAAFWLRLAAVGIVLLLFLLSLQSAASGELVLPALVVLVPATAFAAGFRGILRAAFILAAVVVIVVCSGYVYFGLVLIILGLAALPGQIGPYLRTLFPRRVRSTS